MGTGRATILDRGLNFLDTANLCGAGDSEQVLGRAFSGRRSQVAIATEFNALLGETRAAPNRSMLRSELPSSRRQNTGYGSTMRTLVFCDDYWHPSQVPEQGLGALGDVEFSFDWVKDAGDWSPEQLAGYPLAILTKSNNVSAADQTAWMTGTVQAAFADFVSRGNGLLAIHSGTADYDQTPVLRSLLGGILAFHPEQCDVTVEPHAGHPLCLGSSPFTLPDEHYFVALDDPLAEVFVTTRSEYGEQPAGWRRAEGAGRVAVLTPGHNLEVWLHPSFQTLLLNALRWCGKVRPS